MPVRQLTLGEIERLNALLKLPDEAIVTTRDAVLLSRVGSLSTWQRKKRVGKTPRAIPVNGSTEGYVVGQVKAMHVAHSEPEAA
jgi:hypothetical protein